MGQPEQECSPQPLLTSFKEGESFVPDKISQVFPIPVPLREDKEDPDPVDRKARVEEWKNAPATIPFIEYQGGIYRDRQGRPLYRYPPGNRLEVEFQGQKVQTMDSCEIPWVRATVNEFMRGLRPVSETGRKPKVLIRGFGQGIDSTLVVQKMFALGGGILHIIELNKQVADYAENEWKKEQQEALERQSRSLPGARPHVTIELIRGDAFEETERLVRELRGKNRKIREDRKYDRILSDTFPLTKDEVGVNDLLDLGNIKEILRDDGLLSYFAHFPGYKGGIYGKQEDLLYRHGFLYYLDVVKSYPPPDYRYLHTEEGDPITELPVVICRKKLRRMVKG